MEYMILEQFVDILILKKGRAEARELHVKCKG
jgi:hypothetical protein